MLFGECKWRNARVDVSVLQTLLDRGGLFTCPGKHYYVFSKTGFEKNTNSLSEQFSIRRITFREML